MMQWKAPAWFAPLAAAASLSWAKSRFESSHLSFTLPLPYRVVTQFQHPSWTENVAVLANGDLLLTQLLPEPTLYRVARPTSDSPRVQPIHTFDSVEGLLGISETGTQNVFVVIGGNSSTPGSGAFIAWSLDFRHNAGRPVVTEIAQLHNISLPNGVTATTQCPESVLIADSGYGLVWHLDIDTGRLKVAAELPEMSPAAGFPAAIGINGVKTYGGYLY